MMAKMPGADFTIKSHELPIVKHWSTALFIIGIRQINLDWHEGSSTICECERLTTVYGCMAMLMRLLLCKKFPYYYIICVTINRAWCLD